MLHDMHITLTALFAEHHTAQLGALVYRQYKRGCVATAMHTMQLRRRHKARGLRCRAVRDPYLAANLTFAARD